MTTRTWTARALTRAIRDLGYPHIGVRTRATGAGEFDLRLPGRTAEELFLHPESSQPFDPAKGAEVLSRRLGEPVEVVLAAKGREWITVTLRHARTGDATCEPAAVEAARATAAASCGVPAGEATTILAARESLAAFARAAAAIVAAADLLTAELEAVDVDASTLADARTLTATAAELRAAAEAALTGLNARHQVMEQAVTRTSHTARHEFYHRGGDRHAGT